MNKKTKEKQKIKEQQKNQRLCIFSVIHKSILQTGTWGSLSLWEYFWVYLCWLWLLLLMYLFFVNLSCHVNKALYVNLLQAIACEFSPIVKCVQSCFPFMFGLLDRHDFIDFS